jgi:hypothetical protein
MQTVIKEDKFLPHCCADRAAIARIDAGFIDAG